ncbi:hypothetical protein [Ancylobacter sp. SL191]|uniref:hypothetical protein n=1 Tax=Ancylobacter sp. SL191 TaxID=2995166 RepID=UPI0022717478|nr:hypothetical protein [Ancylobacter sp. SL191]WAC28511.1 hypothetical protein OU996_05510 [Ancylobacter sp. SL191]
MGVDLNDTSTPTPPQQEERFRNIGSPFMLANVNFHGISAEAAESGASVKVWVRGSMTSDQSVFHRVAPNIISCLDFCAKQNGFHPRFYNANTILLVIRPDDSAELWVDSAATTIDIIPKKRIEGGSIIFNSDIADVTEMWFPLVNISIYDKIVVIFREGFRFGLFFDFNEDMSLDISLAKRDLGALHRKMKYADLYAVFSANEIFSKIIVDGWFPFVEIMNIEFRNLFQCYEDGLSTHEEELKIVDSFNDERIDRMFDRWMTKEHFKDREQIICSGLNAYKNRDWIACIKILLTEIEGIIGDAYFKSTGTHTRNINKMLDFVIEAANKMAGGKDTLFFPIEFAFYLKNFIYGNYDLENEKGVIARHAVGHGRAKAEHYTQHRALQTILTLDQFAFYK